MLVEVGDDTLALNVNHISSVEFFVDENPDPKGRMKVKMSNGDVYDLPVSDWEKIIRKFFCARRGVSGSL